MLLVRACVATLAPIPFLPCGGGGKTGATPSFPSFVLFFLLFRLSVWRREKQEMRSSLLPESPYVPSASRLRQRFLLREGRTGGASAVTVGSGRRRRELGEPCKAEEAAVGQAQPRCNLYLVTNSDSRPKFNLDSSPKCFFLRNTPLSLSSCDSPSLSLLRFVVLFPFFSSATSLPP
ncbi:Proteasome subunit alpha type [Zea mays]|uniref:Proteasome subunit alpha type n=1 Tax=Zea mays TaxID=4577 RepID=A0A1D6Q5L1_MAIZE|nr:Proteasome subunit alpha type [Zea mays]AQK53837.1 Proteasome subunit alpha type [Zea mays]